MDLLMTLPLLVLSSAPTGMQVNLSGALEDIEAELLPSRWADAQKGNLSVALFPFAWSADCPVARTPEACMCSPRRALSPQVRGLSSGEPRRFRALMWAQWQGEYR